MILDHETATIRNLRADDCAHYAAGGCAGEVDYRVLSDDYEGGAYRCLAHFEADRETAAQK